MSKLTSRYKGVRYIAKSLTKYFKGKYPKYSDALPKAREVFQQLQNQKQTVKLDNIFAVVRKKRVVKRAGGPQIEPELLTPINYFLLEDYPTWIIRCTNEVWFVSKLWSDQLPPIQGGSNPEYSEYFAPYVNYMNSMKGLSRPEDNRYETDWMVVCTEPEFNKATKRWESKIIPVDESGDYIDYGFNPKDPTIGPVNLILSDKGSKKTQPSLKPEETKPETNAVETQAKEIDLKISESETKKLLAQAEKTKQENISNALKMLSEGVLSKEEFKEIVAAINKKP